MADISTTDTSATPPSTEKIKVEDYENFEDMGLKMSLMRGIFAYGFERPSRIQSQAIVPMSAGHDIVAQAQSGTGKTGTFVISTLQRIDDTKAGCQAIIVSPTRELSQQIANVCEGIGSHLKVTPVLCIGGTNIHDSRKALSSGATVAIGTPGRLIDMIERGFLQVQDIKMFVVDEADEMFSSSFEYQLTSLIQNLPSASQICLFSATMTPEFLEHTSTLMRDPLHILVKTEELTLEGIQQFYINVGDERWKYDTLKDIYNLISVNQAIIYVNTVHRAEMLRDYLVRDNFTVSAINGKMESSERTRIVKEFREGTTRVLISTDLLSRGIDIQQISVVIIYDLPNNKSAYIHRIGRSGRFGRKGTAINFVTERDVWKLEELEHYYATQIKEMPEKVAV